jgi:hypothetical protein
MVHIDKSLVSLLGSLLVPVFRLRLILCLLRAATRKKRTSEEAQQDNEGAIGFHWSFA